MRRDHGQDLQKDGRFVCDRKLAELVHAHASVQRVRNDDRDRHEQEQYDAHHPHKESAEHAPRRIVWIACADDERRWQRRFRIKIS